ncbi:MAG: nucleotidyl transferase AbiEii/AbiGii toxin family protein [Thermoanaerobaculia bacterium]
MNRLQSAFARLVADLRTLKLDWALVGGMAVTVRARPRTTEDLDVVIAVASDREAERVAFSFRNLGYRYLPQHALEQKDVGRLATVRFYAPGEEEGRVIADLLFASSGIESEVVAAAVPEEILPGLVVPVALTGHLVALKVLAGRELDARDVRWLWEVADEGEKQLARDSLILITQRRFNRGKDLFSELARLLAGES